jgi:AcrR family transcriptional regulator
LRVEEAGTRARPLSPDDRKAAIIDACIPLLLEHGAGVTTRQIADASGVAEGTLFRAFGDKDTLIRAAVESFLDPEPIRRSLSYIDPELSLEQKVNDILFHLRTRFIGTIRIMSAIGTRPELHGRDYRQELVDVITEALEAEAPRLRVPPAQAAYIIRIVAFAASFDTAGDNYHLETTDIANFIVFGIGNGLN